MNLPLLPSDTLPSVRRQQLLVAGLHGVALLLLALHLYVRTLPPTQTSIPEPNDAEAAWWGLWPVTYVPTWCVTLGVLLIIGWILGWWLSEIRTSARDRPHTTHHVSQKALTIPLAIISVILLGAFYLFPIVHTRWGDAYLLSKAIAWPDPALRLTHSWQAPLDVFLHSQLWLHLHTAFGWEDAVPVYRLLSPLAGLLYLAGAVGLAREHMIAPGWLTFGVLASLGVLQLFFGYIENYSFAAAGVLLYLWLGLRVLAGRSPLWLAAGALALTNALHPSTVILAPSLLYCGWSRLGKRASEQNKLRPQTVLSTGLSIALPMLMVGLAVIGFMEWSGHGLAVLVSTDRPGGSDARFFVPLWTTTTRWEHYTMFSWPHLRDFLNEQLLVAPIVLPGIAVTFLAGLIEKFRAWNTKNDSASVVTEVYKERPHFTFLWLAGLAYWLFIWVWNPDYGGQRDWDLFSLAAIPAALLLVTLLSRRFFDQRYLQAGTIPLLMLQWLHLAAWVYQNTLPWDWPS